MKTLIANFLKHLLGQERFAVGDLVVFAHVMGSGLSENRHGRIVQYVTSVAFPYYIVMEVNTRNHYGKAKGQLRHLTRDDMAKELAQ